MFFKKILGGLKNKRSGAYNRDFTTNILLFEIKVI